MNDLIAGIYSGHDASFAIFEGGNVKLHCEYERFLRLKEPKGDSFKFLSEQFEDYKNIKYFTSVFPAEKLQQYEDSWRLMNEITKKNNGKFFIFGHHQSHAANAFFSSNFNEATIITLDGGGIENENGLATALTVWYGKYNKIYPIKTLPIHQINCGTIWTRVTRYLFKLSSGFPDGHSAGSCMALSAFSKNPYRFKSDFDLIFTRDLHLAGFKPPGQPDSIYEGKDPKHPFWQKYRELIDNEGQETEFDLAAGLQLATEDLIKKVVKYALDKSPYKKNLCLSGGVTLNAVCFGKLQYENWFPEIENVYTTPTPHDGGLSIGSCQYLWHQVLDNPREDREGNFSPFLGKQYSQEEILRGIEKFNGKIEKKYTTDDDVIDLLLDDKIVAVFKGSAESGRRSLGHRSILANSLSAEIKERLNKIVKERKFYRPFAGSVLREDVKEYFVKDIENPYMSFVVPFKEEYKNTFKALHHPDETNRYQSVRKSDDEWYYEFIKKWKEKSGYGIILNTSFNKHSPINETIEHSIECIINSGIDFLYLPELKMLIKKRS